MAHLSLPLKGLLQDTESKTAGYTPPHCKIYTDFCSYPL